MQSSRRVRATPLKERSGPRDVWLMRFVWFLLQVVSTDTLAVGFSSAIDSLAPVAKDKRDQITSFSTLASSQLLGRCVAERSRFDRFQLSVWFGIVGNNIVPGESGGLLSCPMWVCCAVLDCLCENLGGITMSLQGVPTPRCWRNSSTVSVDTRDGLSSLTWRPIYWVRIPIVNALGPCRTPRIFFFFFFLLRVFPLSLSPSAVMDRCFPPHYSIRCCTFSSHDTGINLLSQTYSSFESKVS